MRLLKSRTVVEIGGWTCERSCFLMSRTIAEINRTCREKRCYFGER